MPSHLRSTHLHIAASRGDLQRVKQLVGPGTQLDVFDELGKTPLHYAAENGSLAIARYLIDAGANVNAHEPRVIGNTPLGEIAGSCSLEMAELLLRAGADPTIRCSMQLCALDIAKDRKRGDGPRVYEALRQAAEKLEHRR